MKAMVQKSRLIIFFVRHVLMGAIWILISTSAYCQTYYVDAQNGNDANNGTSTTTAWSSLTKINNTTFAPGSKILFKANGIWIGQLWPKGSGVSGSPIIIDMYGTGNKPLINGNGLTGSGVLNFVNQSFWEINNLEIINKSSTEGDRLGVKITASNALTNRHIYLKNLSVHDIFGMYTFEMKGKNTGGIGIRITGGGSATRFDDLLIEGCEIYNTVRVGISSYSIYGNTQGNQPITNLKVRNNSIHHTAGDGMILRATDGAVVEYNLAYENHNASEGLVSYGVALWCRSADNTIFQFNEVYNTRGGSDGQAFDADLEAYKTVVQYNYTHNNEGGFMLVYGSSSGSEVRYNISQNDGGVGTHIFDFPIWTTPRGSARIYNNTIYIPSGSNAVVSDEALATSAFYNNIIYNYGNGKSDVVSEGQTAKWDYNIYFGNANRPNDPHLIITDPLLAGPGTGGMGRNSVDGYKLKSGSPALNSGMIISNNGGRDYFGNAVSATSAPHRGAYNGPVMYVPPVADFTVNKNSICASGNVIYTNTSSGENNSYSWNFGSGASPATATGAGPHTVVYSSSGTKTVVLTATNLAGTDTKTKIDYITVNANPSTSAISGPLDVCLDHSKNSLYSVLSTSGSSYQWSIPAGATLVSGNGTNSITMDWSLPGGNISVVEKNIAGCYGSPISANVKVTDCVVQNTMQIAPVQDAYVRDGSYSATAFGQTDASNLVTKNSGAIDNGWNRESYLTFDISSIGGTVNDAKLNLYNTSLTDAIVVSLFAVSNTDWNENIITWNSKPQSASTELANVSVSAAGYYSWDISAYVQSAKAAGISKVSFNLKNITVSAPQLNWNSKEAASNKPYLAVSYTPSTGPVIITTIKDAYVRDGAYANTALGASDPSQLISKKTENVNDGFNRETYVSFDLSSFSETVSSAKIKLFGGLSAGDPVSVSVYPVANNAWTETSITWANKPSPSLTAIATTTVNPVGMIRYTWDVTEYIKSAKSSGLTQVTFCLRNITVVANGPQCIWNSKETGSNPPQLEINGAGAARYSSLSDLAEMEFTLFPNPLTSDLNIRVTGLDASEVSLLVVDGYDHVVYESHFENDSEVVEATIDLSSAPAGIYFVKFISGNIILTKKISKV